MQKISRLNECLVIRMVLTRLVIRNRGAVSRILRWPNRLCDRTTYDWPSQRLAGSIYSTNDYFFFWVPIWTEDVSSLPFPNPWNNAHDKSVHVATIPKPPIICVLVTINSCHGSPPFAPALAAAYVLNQPSVTQVIHFRTLAKQLTIGSIPLVPHHEFIHSVNNTGHALTIPAHTIVACVSLNFTRSVFSTSIPESRIIIPSTMHWMCAVSASFGKGVYGTKKPQHKPKAIRVEPVR